MNSRESGLGRTSAVGCFPGGASPYDLLDCSGNVFEWTRSLWGEQGDKPQFGYPYAADDGREELAAGEKMRRVLRGGNFDYESKRLRCAFRLSDLPYLRDFYFGFRVVVSQLPGP